MLIFVSAGEPSGDLRASELCDHLRSITGCSIYGFGGDSMQTAGVELVAHMRDYSVMGFTGVLASLRRFAALEKLLRREISARRPDAVLLVDYPGLNMRIADWAAGRGTRVIYYVSPQFWAWGRWRVGRVRRSVDLMITLFGFEADFYAGSGVPAFWAGHPLVDAIPHPTAGGNALALLPGSREEEVTRLLDPMLDCAGRLGGGGALEVIVAASPSVPPSLYERAAGRGCRIVQGTAEALCGARAALVCSGTATLEAALHGVPFVLMYRTSPVNYALARLLVRGVESICLASIVAGCRVAAELIQGRATGEAAAEALEPLLADSAARAGALERLALVRSALGPPGGASRAARRVAGLLGAEG